jgi:hypothetical protein
MNGYVQIEKQTSSFNIFSAVRVEALLIGEMNKTVQICCNCRGNLYHTCIRTELL